MGTLSVPKDYSNSSAGTARIALSLRPAKSEHKKGTVFFNPGGPGVRGKPYVIERGDVLQNVVGRIHYLSLNDFDVVIIDRR